MRCRAVIAVVPLAFASVVGAQEPNGSAAGGAATTTQPAGRVSSAGATRKDPKGITGVSPLWEKVATGDRAIAARDLDGALVAYRAAADTTPENALALHRIGQVFTLRGDWVRAEEAYTEALRVVGADAALKAKLLFCLADLWERKRAHDEAIARWVEYSAHAKAHAPKTAFIESATERRKRNEAWQKIASDSAEVKQRADKRLKDADAAALKSVR